MDVLENTIIFTIARMNPPTPGHIYLLENMIEVALKENVSQINIILSSTIDDEKNPVECEEKRQILYNYGLITAKKNVEVKYPDKVKEIEGIKAEIICLNDDIDGKYGTRPVVAKFYYLLYDNYKYPRPNMKAILVVGEDRKNDYGFFEKMLQKLEFPVSFELFVVGRPDSAISATKIRQLATSRNPEDEKIFEEHMNTIGMEKNEASRLINQIRENIDLTPKIKKNKIKGGSKKGKSRKLKKNKKRKKSRKYNK
jgi:hypothetical protein